MTKDLLKRTIDVLEQMRLTDLMQINGAQEVLQDLKKEYYSSSYHFINSITFELPSLLQNTNK
jgi:hypothetical protein